MIKEAIQLTEEETQIINDMMKENAENQKPEEDSESIKAAKAEMKQAYNSMKKLLKARSKSELIELIWTYGVQLQEMQRVAQMLHEENTTLKGESNE